MNRVNEIYRELWKNSYDLAFQNDRLNELYLCSNLLENRYIRAREHMKTGNKIFISHSSKDLHIARALATDFINDGFSVFLDDWSIDLGENIISRISDEIEESHSLVMLISEDYPRPLAVCPTEVLLFTLHTIIFSSIADSLFLIGLFYIHTFFKFYR